MNKKKLTILVIFLWILITAVSVIKNEATLIYGREVLLETVPVDPRDMIMGDYVILNYKIAQLSKYDADAYKINDEVYAVLATDIQNKAYRVYVDGEKPENKLFIKGRVTGCNTTIPFFKTGKCISYGIENYYVKEKTGRELESKLADGALVKVAITKDGKAKVKGFVEK